MGLSKEQQAKLDKGFLKHLMENASDSAKVFDNLPVIIRLKPDLNYRDEKENTPLSIALTKKNEALALYLLSKGADPKLPTLIHSDDKIFQAALKNPLVLSYIGVAILQGLDLVVLKMLNMQVDLSLPVVDALEEFDKDSKIYQSLLQNYVIERDALGKVITINAKSAVTESSPEHATAEVKDAVSKVLTDVLQKIPEGSFKDGNFQAFIAGLDKVSKEFESLLAGLSIDESAGGAE